MRQRRARDCLSFIRGVPVRLKNVRSRGRNRSRIPGDKFDWDSESDTDADSHPGIRNPWLDFRDRYQGHSILSRHDRWTVLLYTTLGASLFWCLVNPPWKISAAHLSGEQWLFLLSFALVSVVLPFSLYFAGLQHLRPTRAIVASCLEPVFSVALLRLS